MTRLLLHQEPLNAGGFMSTQWSHCSVKEKLPWQYLQSIKQQLCLLLDHPIYSLNPLPMVHATQPSDSECWANLS